MKARGDIDLADEVGWLLSAIEAACLLAQMAEGDPDQAARLATNVHAVLRGAVEQLHRLSSALEDRSTPAKTRMRSR